MYSQISTTKKNVKWVSIGLKAIQIVDNVLQGDEIERVRKELALIYYKLWKKKLLDVRQIRANFPLQNYIFPTVFKYPDHENSLN